MPDGALAARAAAGEKTIGGAALLAAPPLDVTGHRGSPATLVVAAQPGGTTTVRCVRRTGQAWPGAARGALRRAVATRRRAARGQSATGRWQGVRLMPASS